MLLVIKEKKQKKEGEKMAVVDLIIVSTLVITIIIAIKIYK